MFFEPQSSHPCNGDNHSMSLMAIAMRLSEMIYVKLLAQWSWHIRAYLTNNSFHTVESVMIVLIIINVHLVIPLKFPKHYPNL